LQSKQQCLQAAGKLPLPTLLLVRKEENTEPTFTIVVSRWTSLLGSPPPSRLLWQNAERSQPLPIVYR